jgi:16S rRNA A1518/A1519 N6-dimethyltransferase RsmA/KsgA/DIM1 with predicted DNA glycosylase/AP lyase activity
LCKVYQEIYKPLQLLKLVQVRAASCAECETTPPGPGGLTQSLLKANCKRVIGVEKDTRFTPILQLLEQSVGSNRLSVAYEDMLRVDEQSLVMDASTTDLIPVTPWSGDDSKGRCLLEFSVNVTLIFFTKDTLQVVGNLPFSVATELLLKWLHQLPERKGVFHWGRVPFTLMFQSEVADVWRAVELVINRCVLCSALWHHLERKLMVDYLL